MTPTDQTELLRKYEPVLRFTRGEKFLPFSAADYISACKIKTPDPRRFHRSKHAAFDPERIDLSRSSPEDYLHFVHEEGWSKAMQVAVFVLLTGLFFIIWYGLSQAQQLEKLFGMPIWANGDHWRMVPVVSVALLWPVFRGDKRVHLAFVLAMVTIAFFGAPVSIGFGFIAIALTLVYGTLFAIEILIRGWSQYLRVAVLGLSSVFLSFAIPLLLVQFLMDNDYLGAEIRAVTIIMLIWALIDVVLLSLWGYLADRLFLYLQRKSRRMEKLAVQVSMKQEVKPVLVIGISTLFILWQMSSGSEIYEGILRLTAPLPFIHIENFVQDMGNRQAVFNLIMIINAGITVFWFFQDPFSLLNSIILAATKSQEQNSPNYSRVFFFCLVSFISWFFLTLSISLERIEIRQFETSLSSIMLLPLLFIAMVIATMVVTIGLNGSPVASFIMELTSLQPDFVVGKAKRKYDHILAQSPDKNKYWYYGRVMRDRDWTVLQYHVFYAYNDWRTSTGGLNNHEGDWEAISVYLNGARDENPFAMVLSQHHSGRLYFWEEVEIVDGTHPVVYVAKGSHANYNRPGIYTADVHVTGFMRNALRMIDQVFRWFRGQTYGLHVEFVIGDDVEREIGRENPWSMLLITDESPDWVAFKGNWGNKNRNKDESGPKGPKWRRIEYLDDGEVPVRPRWGLHDWKDTLLLDMVHNHSLPAHKRVEILRLLTGT